MTADELNSLEALVKSGGAYGDPGTTLALIAGLRRAQECIEKMQCIRDLDLDRSKATAPGTAWGSILREAVAALAAYDEGSTDDR